MPRHHPSYAEMRDAMKDDDMCECLEYADGSMHLCEVCGPMHKEMSARLTTLQDAATATINDIDTYLDWARSQGRTNSELKRIGSQLRAAIAESEGP